MAHPEAVRGRAQRLFMGRVPIAEIASRLKVPLGTVKHWSRDGGWGELRRLNAELERESAELAVAMARRARETADPQQAFAATHAAELTRRHTSAPASVSVRDVAAALVRVLAAHPAVGPVVQKHRAEVLALVIEEAERMEEVHA